MSKKKTQKPELSIIIPAFNEEKTIATVLKQVIFELKQLKLTRCEIIIIDDGSTDNTSKKIVPFINKPFVSYIKQSKNQGKGAAIKLGFQKAKGEIVIIQDADLEYHPKYYKSLILPIQQKRTKVVYGSRLAKIPLNLKNIRSIKLPWHFIANKTLSFLTNLIYSSQITDMETGYKAFHQSIIKGLNLKSKGFEIEVEITAKILRAGHKIQEVPITTKPRDYDEGKKITYIDGIKAVYYLIKYRLNHYLAASSGILLLALVMRFWDFLNRYGLWSDQARDVLVARVALNTLNPPLVGSFSSAGPFTFGPIWYYYAMLTELIFPTHLGYWIGTSLLSVTSIAAIMWITQKISSSFAGLAAGLLAAISYGHITSALQSTQHSLALIFSTFFLFAVTKFIYTKKSSWYIVSGLFLSLTINAHYQGFYLIPLFILLTTYKRPSLKSLIATIAVGFIPWIPMLIFDLKNNWWNLTEIIDYYRFGQYRIYVPNRWLTYAGVFWPDFWQHVVGGLPWLAYAQMVLIATIFAKDFFQKKLNSTLILLAIGWLLAIIWFRYFRAERNFAYLSYAQPLIFIFTAWMLERIRSIDKIVGITFLIILILGSYTRIWANTSHKNPRHDLDTAITKIQQQYPNQKFSIYDQGFNTTYCSIPLSLILDDQDKISPTGVKIGACSPESCPKEYPKITSISICDLVDLSSTDSATLANNQWSFLNPNQVHHITVEWWK